MNTRINTSVMTHKRLRVAIVVLALVLAQLGRSPTTARALTLTVNTTSDLSGTGCLATPQCSLRRAINEANANPGPDIIQFNIPGTDPGCSSGVCTIQPAGALPALTGDGTTVDGYTQPGAAPASKTGPAVLKIELDGSNAGAAVDGLTVNSAGNAIQGLVINRFSASGVSITGSGAAGNAVSGNYVGVDVTGTAVLSNTYGGVVIDAGAQDNVIGGDTAGERNVISGNGSYGVYIAGSGTTNNTVSGNFIGTDANGAAALGNGYGVYICNGAQNNTVGGDTAGERNVISGSDWHGVWIKDSSTTGNVVSGNYIGTDAGGTAALGNTQLGVRITAGAQHNVIGGDTAGERNVISGNGGSGVWIESSGTMSNTISGNYIGTAADGTTALGNTSAGIAIQNGPCYNTVGGDTPGERNVISGNRGLGVVIDRGDATGNTISGNFIGLAADGTSDLGNSSDGVWIYGDAQGNIIGGDTAGERNIISCNGGSGIYIFDHGATNNTVSGNYIGTDASGTLDRGNAWNGITIEFGPQTTAIGPNNLIAHNGGSGVRMAGSTTNGNVVTQNSIFANDDLGIDLLGGANSAIAAPAILGSTFGPSVSVVGTACAGCTVELFANGDTDGEGEAFIGDTVANGSGGFTVTVPVGSLANQPHLTATATDVVSGTSEFSAVYTVDVQGAFLPFVLKGAP